jgi:uncharacterized protein (TIGR02594 family)
MSGYEEMKALVGLEENKDKKKLMDLFKSEAHHNDIVIDPSTTPWCSAAMNYAERKAGNEGSGALNARSWLKIGEVIYDKATHKGEDDDGKEGDLMIFERGHDGWSGHITYLVSYDIDNNRAMCLGGNQGDKVCYAYESLDKLLGIRRT